MKKIFILVAITITLTLVFYNKIIQKISTKIDLSNSQLDESPNSNMNLYSSQDSISHPQKTNIIENLLSRQNSITKATEKIKHSVVSVNVIKTRIVRRYTNPFENPFFGFFDIKPYAKQEVKSIGSGVIFNSEGYIITNSHVVEGATKIKVILENSDEYDAILIGEDPIQDIAILKIEGENHIFATLGTSSDLISGEWAIAVGNPYGFIMKDSQPSVSVGVISAVNRNFAENREHKIYKKMIQTDAAINPGNSGGPLVNILGQVIGINTFIISDSGGNVGIGFAIPIDRVKKTAKELIGYGKIRDRDFGFVVQDITPRIRAYYEMDNKLGVLVKYVKDKSPAMKAGLKRGDIIIKINETAIINADDAELSVSDTSVGDNIHITFIRNKKTKTTSFKLQEIK